MLICSISVEQYSYWVTFHEVRYLPARRYCISRSRSTYIHNYYTW